MEQKLKNLKTIMDEELYTKPVFTAKDEEAVLRKIQELRYVKIKPKKRNVMPQLLTAAVVAGLAFTGYEVMNHDKAPNTAVEKNETKELFAAPTEQFSQPKGTATYDPDMMSVDVQGRVVNTSKHNGVPFKMKLVLKNPSLADAAGQSEVLVDVPSGVMRAGDPFSFASSIALSTPIDPAALENGVEVVFFNDDRVLSSYVISDLVINEPAPPQATKINVETVDEIRSDEGTQLNVQVTFEGNSSAEIVNVLNDENYRKNVTFDVRDENVVTVSETGVVQAVREPAAYDTVITVTYQDEMGEVLTFEVPVKIEQLESLDLGTLTWEELVAVMKPGMTMEQVKAMFGSNYRTSVDDMDSNLVWDYRFGMIDGYKTYYGAVAGVDVRDVEGLEQEKIQKIVHFYWKKDNTIRAFSMYTGENGEFIKDKHKEFEPSINQLH
ncbi:hypothetical protein ACFQPF_06950 [Fictibacillus iocasae]|uniref:DUF4179 domain-containing protein n=1 Tax=Fictibacillus iocasae TaxID=2715437 RepID=A0ABW2NR15_9BACL